MGLHSRAWLAIVAGDGGWRVAQRWGDVWRAAALWFSSMGIHGEDWMILALADLLKKTMSDIAHRCFIATCSRGGLISCRKQLRDSTLLCAIKDDN